MTDWKFNAGDKVRLVKLDKGKTDQRPMTVERVGGISYPFAILCSYSSGKKWFHLEDLEAVKK